MIDLDETVRVGDLITLASDLKSDGENPEYDRALVELVSDVVYSCGDDHTRAEVERAIGIGVIG